VHVPSAPKQQASFVPGRGQVAAVDTPGVASPQLQVDTVGTAESSIHEYAPQSQLPLAGHSSVDAQYQTHPGVFVAGGHVVAPGSSMGAVL
jgi:hypothetical protein